MIKLTVEIELALLPGSTNEFGAGVHVHGIVDDPAKVPEAEGATMIGICMAINDYMRSRGAANFNCLKQLLPNV